MKISRLFIITVYLLIVLGLLLGYICFLYYQFNLGFSFTDAIPDWLAFLFQSLLFIGFLYQGAELVYRGKQYVIKTEKNKFARWCISVSCFAGSLILLFLSTYMLLTVVFGLPIKDKLPLI